PFGELTDAQGTVHRLSRVSDRDAVATVQRSLAEAELLIADGHHRYETARVYAEEIGGEGPHRYVLMCLVALEDPGLTVLPTHRLVRGLDAGRQEALAASLRRDFEIEEDEALALVRRGAFDAAFFMRGTPIAQVRAIAASGENMPPKSTFFHPKVPTGLLFNPLDEE